MSRERAKGTAWETALVKWLRANGFPHAERRALHGAHDQGDVTGIPGLVVEAKHAARVELAAWVDEANDEADNAGAALGVAWFKRRGKASPGDAFVVMDGATFAHLLRLAGYGDAGLARWADDA